MFKFFLKSVKNKSSENSTSSNENHKKDEHGLLPIRLYLAVFFILLIMIFMNIAISKLPISTFWMTAALIFVATIQTILVAVFFMELVHEDKFYSFVFGSSILFMLLFFAITLGEIRGRDFFNKNEGIKMMRAVDQNGNFAPGGPKIEHEEKK